MPAGQEHLEKHSREEREPQPQSQPSFYQWRLTHLPSTSTDLLGFIYAESFYIKSSIIAEIPLLFKLIYFLMFYLHSGICILFHSKCYDSTCPILDKTEKIGSERRE